MSTLTALMPISDASAARLQRQLAAHGGTTGRCRECRRPRCMPWKDAYAELAAAGRLDVSLYRSTLGSAL